MIKTGDSNRRLGIVLMVLAVLVAGITATSYADPLGPTDQVSGPAVVGTLQLIGNASDVTVLFNGKCKGKVIEVTDAENVMLPTTLEDITAARLLEGLRFTATAGVSSECPFINFNFIVKAVSKFMKNGAITAEVILLYVVTTP
jgi:hypothetical protein